MIEHQFYVLVHQPNCLVDDREGFGVPVFFKESVEIILQEQQKKRKHDHEMVNGLIYSMVMNSGRESASQVYEMLFCKFWYIISCNLHLL